MIGLVGYVVLMHRLSPVAWLGHKRKWLRLREIQERLCINRHQPELGLEAVTWLHVLGLRAFKTPQPEVRMWAIVTVVRSGFIGSVVGCFEGWKKWLALGRPLPSQSPSDVYSQSNVRQEK